MEFFITIVTLVITQSYADVEIPYTETLFKMETSTVEELPPLPGLLYPRESESREVKSLDGLWDFSVTPDDLAKNQQDNWLAEELSKSVDVMQMPVPSSYNDITTSAKLRDHVGAVWYERNFFVPLSWTEQRVFVRFGSVNYLAQVWVNGIMVMNHEMGHLPFEAEISQYLIFGSKNRITVAVDNTLLQTSVPQGKLSEAHVDNGTSWIQSYTFDFFNYAEYLWSEDYQTALFSQHFKAFDYLRNNYNWFIGELIWNFADFQTPPCKYFDINKIRNRTPKMAAYLVRKRYHTLAFEIDQQDPPDDLEYYISSHAASCMFTISKM